MAQALFLKQFDRHPEARAGFQDAVLSVHAEGRDETFLTTWESVSLQARRARTDSQAASMGTGSAAGAAGPSLC